jgi:hypothetical protein
MGQLKTELEAVKRTVRTNTAVIARTMTVVVVAVEGHSPELQTCEMPIVLFFPNGWPG